MRLRRLHPDPGVVEPRVALEGLDLAPPPGSGRPYVLLNMVATVDGHAAVGGRSGPIGGPADREVFHGLREQADAVLAGTGTLRAERYGRLVRDPERRARRAARGLRPDPLAVILSRSGDVPEDLPLLADPDQEAVVLTGDAAEPRAALARLHTEHGVRCLLCEGGPTLNGALLSAGVVDELFLTLGPRLAGGSPFSLVGGPPFEPPIELELAWILEHDGEVFLRYRVVRGCAHG